MKTIEIKTKPIPVNALYRCVQGRNILSKKGRETKDALAWEIAAAWQNKPITGDVTVNLLFYFGDLRKRDIDAYLKALLDAAEGIVYENDCQIVELHVYKEIDKANPRTIMQIL